MRTTMDKAGRVVIPSQIRERLGLVPGPVDLIIDGTGVRLEVEARGKVVEEDGILVIQGGSGLNADDIRELRLAGQR
ncbi:AbrB/MazE/SpoVT family DNA-binding domain-containing protein [Microbacterium sp. PMB16]|uniref:AbrB/MazE/SpoVT family DNA-binding domain-containing protein n=1 Tax=Microbacterium sp. PMB16 TaxID=3120157 RepID=UPI003F4B8856